MRTNPWKALSLTLAVALSASWLAPVKTADAAPPSNLESALEKLEAALSSLQKATQDQGGHRARAINHTKQAIDEVKLGIAAARREKPAPAPTPAPTPTPAPPPPAPAPLVPKP